ncbi:MAG: glutamyl-tRNA reductase [Clostridiales bacterium]|nr:glutamyl-tRNA reductase [Clostridiales bacterium]
MNIYMIGVNYRTAGIELREKVSFTPVKIKKLLEYIKTYCDISGAVMISTCNRTELYLSSESEINDTEITRIFCEASNVEGEDFSPHLYIKANHDAAMYLFELTCGIHSMIFGDDQIVSQVKDSIQIANEVGSSDATLNTLFRYAITSAKKVKTNVVLRTLSPSVAKQAADIVSEFIKHNPKCRALVIGNGEVGRNVCSELVSLGCEVYMTLRTYKHSKTIVPYGCKTIDYAERQKLIETVDIIISATTSPHHTITFEMIEKSEKRPKYIIDLALPRDIDPEVQSLQDIIYYDVDTIGKTALMDNSNEIATMKTIIDEQIKKFHEWAAIQSCHMDIEEIKKYAIGKIISDIDPELCEEEKLQSAIVKTLNMIFYSLKESTSVETIQNIANIVLARR